MSFICLPTFRVRICRRSRDYPLLKRKFSAIRKTYATVLKPYTCDILIRGKLHRLSIRLVDTMLIGPAGVRRLHLSATR